jgi:hypothetical protein
MIEIFGFGSVKYFTREERELNENEDLEQTVLRVNVVCIFLSLIHNSFVIVQLFVDNFDILIANVDFLLFLSNKVEQLLKVHSHSANFEYKKSYQRFKENYIQISMY